MLLMFQSQCNGMVDAAMLAKHAEFVSVVVQPELVNGLVK